MANLTRADLADRALELLGVKPPTQASTATDANRAREKLDSVHAMLRKRGLAPFLTSAIPEWAQDALAHMVADKLMTVYGVQGERAARIARGAEEGWRDLCAQLEAQKHQHPIKARYY